MAWLESLPDSIIVSEQKYIEKRTNPDNPDLEQYRKRIFRVREYRGVTLATAQAALSGYPIITTFETTTRSFNAIGGGGYTVVQTADVLDGSTTWIDF